MRRSPTSDPAQMSGRRRTALVVLCALLLGAFSGVALAQDSSPEEGLTPAEGEQMVDSALHDAAVGKAYFDAMWRAAADKAAGGELKADVSQKRAEELLRAQIDPPADVDAANDLEEQMIELSAKLRESGDLPPLDESAIPNPTYSDLGVSK